MPPSPPERPSPPSSFSGERPEDSVYFGKDLEAMSFAQRYHRWIVDEFAPFLGRSVGEVGAGVGNVSEMLLALDGDRRVEQLTAFEPDVRMFADLERALAPEPRAQAIQGFFGADQAGAGYDSLVYVNVMEHVEHDRREMRHAFAALRPGGHLLVFVPALQWLYSPFDEKVGHYRRYTKRSLTSKARAVGFEIAHARYFDVAGILPWYVNFVLMKNEMAGAAVSLYDNAVVPVMKRVERALPPPIGKNVLLAARKPA
jgi:SAM-dependent methyltransferase